MEVSSGALYKTSHMVAIYEYHFSNLTFAPSAVLPSGSIMLSKLFPLIFLAVSAITTASIESSALNRLLQLDLGLRRTYILLDRLDEESAHIVASDIVVAYNAIVAPGTCSIEVPFPNACDPSIQFAICQAYHTFAITSISLYFDLTDGATNFNKELRHGLHEGFHRIYDENAKFVDTVAPTGLPLCLESIQWDCWALNEAFNSAYRALDPATVPS
ncbi:uncharacterized protein BDV17DRAFT_292628 [Aspergillus undulatus]|uniref:uncharacterized protein n=1 Tax=Aspergillus undulatus TaxID=1810928 RepID=UPI003CCE1947